MTDPDRYPGVPRWVKGFGIAVGAAVVLLVVALHVGGGLRHDMPSIGARTDPATPENGR